MKNKDNLLYIGGSVIIIVLAIIFVLLLMLALQPVPVADPTPTLYEFPTAVASATIEPSPTNTAEPTVTNTVQPTKTPVPTATVDIEATVQAERVAVYLALFDDLDQTARTTKARFENTFGQLIEGKVNEHDDTWRGEVTALLATFNGHLAQMRGITPPPGYEIAHDTVIYGMERCSMGWQGMYDATQTGDHAAYDRAIPYVHECSESWTEGENRIANLRR
jgi:hypothetical protein